MRQTKTNIPHYAKSLTVCLSLLLFIAGCAEKEPETIAEAAKNMNDADRGLVRSMETEEAEAVAKYLTPQYLALAESKGNQHVSVDSLVTLYQNSLNFYVSIENKEEDESLQEMLTHSGGRDADIGNVQANPQDTRFYLEAGGKRWEATHAVRESIFGEAKQRWYVVFAINPEMKLSAEESVTLVSINVDRKVTSQFTYSVADLLHPELLASNN